jgi:hypothetical protein
MNNVPWLAPKNPQQLFILRNFSFSEVVWLPLMFGVSQRTVISLPLIAIVASPL